MIRTILLFITLLVSVWIGVQLSHDPGYVLIALNHWTIESTLWVFLIGIILLVITVHSVLIILRRINRSPRMIKSWMAKRRVHRAQVKTRQGLIQFSEGKWLQAKNHLIEALPDSDSPLLNYLTAARAAQELGDNQLRDHYLREAQQSMPEAKIAVELTQAQLQLANKQWEQALATLRHVHDLAPHHPYVLKQLLRLYKEVKDWPQLIALLPELKKYKVVTGKAFVQLQHETYHEAMKTLAQHGYSNDLKAMYSSLPNELKYEPDLVAIYVSYLLEQGNHEEALKLLKRGLKKEYSDILIYWYGLTHGDKHQLEYAESFVKKYSNSAALYLALGRIAHRQQLWGKARQYFESSIAIKPTPGAYANLGALLEFLNLREEALDAYRQGLILVS